MKLPESLPRLEEPSFVLASPRLLQVAVLALLIAVPPLLWAWTFDAWRAGRAGFGHYALAAVGGALLAAGLWRRNRRRWVVFAADRRGVYLRRMSGDYLHVPWADVGPSTIGIAGRGSNRQRTVILSLRLDAETCERLLGRQKRATRTPDGQGFVPYGIGGALRGVEETRQRIEAVRRAAAG